MTTNTVVTCSGCGARNRIPDAATGVPRCATCHTPLPWIVDADTATFERILATTRLAVVVDLWAPWCGPCRVVSPLLEQLASEFAGRVRLVKVNVDQSPAVQARFGVQGIPTFVLLRRGDEIGRLVGAHPLHALREWIETGIGTGS